MKSSRVMEGKLEMEQKTKGFHHRSTIGGLLAKTFASDLQYSGL